MEILDELATNETNLLRIIFDMAGDAIIACSEEGFAVECNQTALEMFACTHEQMIGSTPLTFSPEFQPNGRRSDEMASEVFAQVKSQGIANFEWENRLADGSRLEVDVTVRSARLGERVLFIIISRDITERKQSRLSLMRSEKLLREVQVVANLGYYERVA